jgi:hypothetical protein
MNRVVRLGMIAVVTVATVLTPALAANVTVGGFYTKLAQAKHLGSSDAASAEANLRGAGFALPKLALDKSLTEGDMTSIANSLGLALTTQRPSQPISESQVTAFITTFGSQLGAPTVPGDGQPQIYGQGTGGTDPGNSGNGKGKKKGHNKSTSEPI